MLSKSQKSWERTQNNLIEPLTAHLQRMVKWRTLVKQYYSRTRDPKIKCRLASEINKVDANILKAYKLSSVQEAPKSILEQRLRESLQEIWDEHSAEETEKLTHKNNS